MTQNGVSSIWASGPCCLAVLIRTAAGCNDYADLSHVDWFQKLGHVKVQPKLDRLTAFMRRPITPTLADAPRRVQVQTGFDRLTAVVRRAITPTFVEHREKQKGIIRVQHRYRGWVGGVILARPRP